jgi:hypothetical protein
MANKIRPFVWSGAIAAVTAVGTIYGAGLNIRQEYKQVSRNNSLHVLIKIYPMLPSAEKDIR